MPRLPTPTSATPNVILIITDDQGYGTVACHGDPHVRTPNMDRLASEGAECTRFYGNPLCSPTRAALMTGRYPYRTGILHTSRGGALMSGDEVTAAGLFADAGYRTGIFGKWHLGDNYPMRPMDQGFHEAVWHKGGGIGQTPVRPNSYFDPHLFRGADPFQSSGYCTDVFFDEALRFVESSKDRPFFAFIPTNAPHDPLEVADEWADPYREMGVEDRVARIYGMVENIDHNIGRLLDTLARLEIDDNTLIVFMSDHGPASGRYNAGLRSSKVDVYEGGIRVPFFMRWPAGLRSGTKVDRIAAHIDVLPTLLSVCGIDPPSDRPIDGLDLSPLLADPSADWPDRTLFIQTHRGSAPRRYHNAAAISQSRKWLSHPGTGGRWTYDASAPNEELYDLATDPGEQSDLASAEPATVAAFRAAYDAWFTDVTAGWSAGRIHVGNDAENPITLCRYQDCEYLNEVPIGWHVCIERSATYEVAINRSYLDAPGALAVTWRGRTTRHPLASGVNSARLDLDAGTGLFNITLELQDIGPIIFTSNQTIGDITLTRL